MRNPARALVAAVAFALAAALTPAHAHAAGPVRLVIGVAGPLDQPTVEQEIDRLQYPPLVALAADTLDPIPGLAEAWTPAADGWTYTLRAGTTWSDGTPVTAADVVFSLEQQPDDFPGVSATVVDDRTVAVAGVDEPTLLLPILPEHAYASDPGVGAGSWRVVARTDDTVTMQVVDQPGRPRLDEIEFRSYADSAALLDALRSGDVDVAGALPAPDYDELKTIDEATAIHANDGDQWIMRLRIPESETRRAIARAIHRDDLVATVANDVARTSPIPIVARGNRWRLDDDESARLSTRLSYDPAAPNIAGAVTLYAPDDETGKAIAEYVTTSLEELGLTVSEGDAATADVVIALRDPGDDPTGELASYTCAGGIWCDPRYDAAYDAFTATTDTATRIDAVQEMVRLLAADAPEVVLYEPDTLQGVRTDNVTGLLREPSVERLVVFWPSVQQYSEAVPTSTLGGEDIPDSAFAAIAVGATVVAVGGYFVVRAFDKRRQRTHSPA